MSPMTALDAPTLNGETIYLEKLGRKHLSDMHEYSASARFYTYMELKPYETMAETEQYLGKLLRRVSDSHAMYWAICMKRSKKMIGTFGMLNIGKEHNGAEIGYGISPVFWNRGIFKEALAVVIHYAFGQLSLNQLTARTMRENVSSIRGLARLGFQMKQVISSYYRLDDGRRRDAVLMEIQKQSPPQTT